MTVSGDETEETGDDGAVPDGNPGRIARARARAEEAKKVGAEMLAREQAHRFSVRVAVQAYDRDRSFAGGLLAGGLAFRVFLWMLPFSLVVVSLFGNLVHQLEQPASDLAQRAGLSAALAGTVAQAVDASGEGRWYLLVVGGFLVLWAGMGLVKATRLISGLAWDVPPKMSQNPLASSAMVVVVVSVVLGVHLLAIWLQDGPFASDLASFLGEAIALIAIATWVFWKLPHSLEANWTAMLPGGVVVAVGVLVSRLVTAVYFVGRLDRVDDLYGALGVASVFLAWLFIISRLWVAGASLNASGYLASRQELSGVVPDE